MLASRIPEELSLRTFELGVISFRPDAGAVPHHCRLWRQPGLHREPAASAGLGLTLESRSTTWARENFIAHNVASPLRRKVIEAFQRYRTPLQHGH
jgi:hypothetical protein